MYIDIWAYSRSSFMSQDAYCQIYRKMLPSFCSLLIWILVHGSLILADEDYASTFKYIHQDCYGYNQDFDASIKQATQIVARTVERLTPGSDNTIDPLVTRMMVTLFGEFKDGTEAASWVTELQQTYERISNGLTTPAEDSNLYAWCGDNLIWSTRLPDPSKAECIEDFDPTKPDDQDCGIDVQGGGGFWYASSPFEDDRQDQNFKLPLGFRGKGKWVQLEGVKNFPKTPGGSEYQPKESLCSEPTTNAATVRGPKSRTPGYPVFHIYCKPSFEAPSSRQWSTDNTNQEYFRLPSGQLSTYLRAHQGNPSFRIIHELVHTFDLGMS